MSCATKPAGSSVPRGGSSSAPSRMHAEHRSATRERPHTRTARAHAFSRTSAPRAHLRMFRVHSKSSSHLRRCSFCNALPRILLLLTITILRSPPHPPPCCRRRRRPIRRYGHFYVEHTLGHHKLVCTDEDPATARFGESFYAFLPRVVRTTTNTVACSTEAVKNDNAAS